MKEGGIGGSNTQSGLYFERDVDFQDLLAAQKGYKIQKQSGKPGMGVYFDGTLVARSFRRGEFYKYLEELGINWKAKISSRLLPDDSILVIVRETLFIIEVKFQRVQGSVDEKLQTCDFKRKQYLKLLADKNVRVEYVYILSDWFKQAKYRDVLQYVQSVHCHYRFNTLPLTWLGLPDPLP